MGRSIGTPSSRDGSVGPFGSGLLWRRLFPVPPASNRWLRRRSRVDHIYRPPRFPAACLCSRRPRPSTPRVCCNLRRAYGEGLLLPFINWERYSEDSPLRRAGFFRDMPSRSSSSHAASRLSFTLGRGGRLRFISRVPSPGMLLRVRRGIHGLRPGLLRLVHVCGLFVVRHLSSGDGPTAPDRQRSTPAGWTAFCRRRCRLRPGQCSPW